MRAQGPSHFEPGRHRLPLAVAAIALAGVLAVGIGPAAAALGDCSQPVSNGAIPSATDCLVILQVAVNIRACTPEACVCAPKGALPTSATDALICLKKATGQNVTLNCPCGGGTTTTTSTTSTVSSTTTSTTTTTMGTPTGFCPSIGSLVLYAGTTGIACTTNSDCVVGVCDDAIGRCITATDLDTGWTGLAHNSDINDQVAMQANLSCPTPFNPNSAEPCGECEVTGLRADTNNCRCRQNNRSLCFEPFAVDPTDCSVAVTCQFPSDCKVCSESLTPCLVDDDCPGAEFCMNGLRQPNCDKGGVTAPSNCSEVQTRPCSSNTDCANGNFCAGSLCRKVPASPVACPTLNSSSGCDTGELCMGRCEGNQSILCTANSQCGTARPCVASFCTEAVPATCSADAQCRPGEACGDGYCRAANGPACTQDDQCPIGPFGQEEFCMNEGACIGTCDCYFGPPLPLSSSNTPACVVNRFAEDVTGVANVDRGAGQVTASLRAIVFLGELVTIPCPACGGTCENGTTPGIPCLFDTDCSGGTCGNFDTVIGDGVREGTCYLGGNNGESCDIDAQNETFPAPGGGGSSLDCFPSLGKNVSGTGLIIDLTQTTGTVSLESNLPCYFPFNPDTCPCGKCGGPTGDRPCTSNADCPAGEGACLAAQNGNQQQNGCSDRTCTPNGDGTGTCLSGPTTQFCDGILRANGVPFVTCLSNADCEQTDCGPVACGACTLAANRDCFPTTITATGTEAPNEPIGAAAFCIADTSNPGINSVAGLPGAGRVINQSAVTYFCSNDPNQVYVPGVGGCQ